jgi:hypothetical protein
VKEQDYKVEEALVDVVFVVVVVVDDDDIDSLLQAMVYYEVMDSSSLDDDNDYCDSYLVLNYYLPKMLVEVQS